MPCVFPFVAGGLCWSPALSQILRYLHGRLRIAGGGKDPDDLVLLVRSRHLIGGEVNCVLENTAAQSGEPDAKLTGEKTPLGDQIVGLTD